MGPETKGQVGEELGPVSESQRVTGAFSFLLVSSLGFR